MLTMPSQDGDSRRRLLGAALAVFTVLAVSYAVVVAVTDDIGAAVLPSIFALVLAFNCILVLSGRVSVSPNEKS